jgi:hypothetical protein
MGIEEVPVGEPGWGPDGVAAGPDNALWIGPESGALARLAVTL